MRIKNLTVLELKKACKENNYLLLSFRSGHTMGLNTKISEIAFNKFSPKDETETDYISYEPCSFHQYLSHKHPFLSS